MLAGNASRSQIVTRLFGLTATAPADQRATKSPAAAPDAPATDALTNHVQNTLTKLFGERTPQLTVHPPLPVDAGAVFRPTAKTGVALGLLNLCPGGVVKVINHAATESKGEAPFAFYVGRERHGHFQVGLHQGCAYGEWHELGTPRARVFNLYYTQLPRAHTGDVAVGEPGLYKKRLDLLGQLDGHKLELL